MSIDRNPAETKTYEDYEGKSSGEIAEEMFQTREDIGRTFSLLTRRVVGADGRRYEQVVGISDTVMKVTGFVKKHPVTSILVLWLAVGAVWNVVHAEMD